MAINVTKVKPEFKDKRGFISRIIDQKTHVIKSILYIKRKAGSIGANHYHKKDAHYIYVLNGRINHSEKSMNDPKAKVESVILKPGDLVFTPPMVGHKDEFLKETTFLAFTTKNRNTTAYEKDTVRIKLT